MSDRRDQFLIELYKQMMNDINRHILVIWQSIATLVAAFAVFALVEKKVVTLDLAASIVVLLCGWLCLHLLDASYWYNRNLAIIANIERQFLLTSDLRDIHYYFGSHRPDNRMIKHLKIQQMLGIGLGCLVVLYHLLVQVLPGLTAPISNFEPQRMLPYVIVAAAVWYWNALRKNRNTAYAEFLANSPGIAVNTDSVSYGVGHGYDDRQTPSSTKSPP